MYIRHLVLIIENCREFIAIFNKYFWFSICHWIHFEILPPSVKYLNKIRSHQEKVFENEIKTIPKFLLRNQKIAGEIEIMSFRSRSRTVQPVVQRRSLSGSRLPNNLTSYTSNRPMSSAYPSSTSYTTSNYISPYTGVSSRDNIYNSIPSTRSSYYNIGGTTSRRDSYNGSSTIYKNPYASDRYISPYASYDNGVTTAGLSIKSSTYTTNGYTNKNAYTSMSNKPLNRHSKLNSASNTSLNSYSTPSMTTSASISAAANATSNTSIGRSQSFRDQASERKGRSLRRNSSLKSERSLSVSSEKSEGYEVRYSFYFLLLIWNVFNENTSI